MAKNTEKDRQMAANMRENGVTRTVGRCPVCNSLVSVKGLYNHIAFSCR